MDIEGMQLLDYRLSIIIPVLNEAGNIQQCLQALQAWRKQGHELIVVDGHSTDNTVELAKPLCDKLLVSMPGRALQMNTGAELARGNILLFLHADTRLPENAVTEVIKVIKQTGKQWGRFDIRLSSHRPLMFMVGSMMNLRSRLTGIATGDQAMFVRRDIFHRVQGFPDIALMEDISLSHKLLRLSRPACIRAKAVTSSRRWEQNGVLRTILLMWYLRLAYFLGKSPESLARIYSRP